VTLEFSNTTPLPAKIYANDGVAQVIFIESDEVCEDFVQGSRRGVPGTEGRHPAQDLNRAGNSPTPYCVSDLPGLPYVVVSVRQSEPPGRAGGARNAENTA
jgi:hypothetical protein